MPLFIVMILALRDENGLLTNNLPVFTSPSSLWNRIVIDRPYKRLPQEKYGCEMEDSNVFGVFSIEKDEQNVGPETCQNSKKLVISNSPAELSNQYCYLHPYYLPDFLKLPGCTNPETARNPTYLLGLLLMDPLRSSRNVQPLQGLSSLTVRVTEERAGEQVLNTAFFFSVYQVFKVGTDPLALGCEWTGHTTVADNQIIRLCITTPDDEPAHGALKVTFLRVGMDHVSVITSGVNGGKDSFFKEEITSRITVWENGTGPPASNALVAMLMGEFANGGEVKVSELAVFLLKGNPVFTPDQPINLR